MKKIHALIGSLTILLSICTLPAQLGQKVNLNTEQARQELEILKGVMEATLRFSGEEAWEGRIQSFYLHRQGAVFVVPVGSRGFSFGGDLARLERLIDQAASGQFYSEELLDSMYRRLDSLDRARLIGELPEPVLAPLPPAPPGSVSASELPPEPPPAPPAPAAVPAPPAPPAPGVAYVEPRTAEASAAYSKALEARLKAFEANLQERKANLEKQEQAAQERLLKVSEKLVEAIAKYADALTVVGADEYVTLILSSSSGFPFQLHRDRSAAKVWTMSKKSILEYNAGRLTLEAFKRQILEYEL